MGFFDGVLDCNKRNGGAHQWGEPQADTLALTGHTDYVQRYGDCGVGAIGKTPAEAMDRAQETDRAHRSGGLW